jgi:hypothetical protein
MASEKFHRLFWQVVTDVSNELIASAITRRPDDGGSKLLRNNQYLLDYMA